MEDRVWRTEPREPGGQSVEEKKWKTEPRSLESKDIVWKRAWRIGVRWTFVPS